MDEGVDENLEDLPPTKFQRLPTPGFMPMGAIPIDNAVNESYNQGISNDCLLYTSDAADE